MGMERKGTISLQRPENKIDYCTDIMTFQMKKLDQNRN
jgi:hypothetical protein